MTQRLAPVPLAMRLLQATPVVGTITRDIQKDINSIYYALVILVTLVVLGVQTWGLVALAMTALAMVPIMLVTLIAITLG
ncbi:hypothetical protein [Pseudorhodobacter ferrugineus]|uniref:hypothetical protein n=1 Tax=Pseudorhodobacter ferrugineus TaxID=77008 RepID=UPI0003B4F6FD|nr:hypothetical protein [Pseudorhodobacter ferrugineus]